MGHAAGFYAFVFSSVGEVYVEQRALGHGVCEGVAHYAAYVGGEGGEVGSGAVVA